MYCPNCNDIRLNQYITPSGIEIDFCPKCNGNWLDKGEILFFVENKEFVEKELKKSIKKSAFTNKLSPISKEPMETINYLEKIKIDYCKQSEGLWFDRGEFSKFSKISNIEALDFENNNGELVNKFSVYFEEEFKETNEKTTLIKLPNLIFTSFVTMGTVFSLFTLFFLSILTFFSVDLYISIGLSILFSFMGLFISPMLYDFNITTFMSGKLVDFNNLPDNIQNLSSNISNQYNIKIPKFYIIQDEAPQAFTYGYSPNSGRIVLSQGLLNLLNDDEVDGVVAHEFGHIIHWDMVLMSIIMVIPKITYLIYKHFVEQMKNKETSSSNGDNKKGTAQLALIAVVAYILFYISQLFVLYFSRVREYHADRFSASFTKSPHSLANALVKIGYGLIKTSDQKTEKEHTLSSSPLNIFDNKAVPAFAISSFSSHQNQDNIDDLKEVMKWDLWNPWSSWYELNSTHPLIANRLIALSNIAETQNKKQFFIINEKKPESYHDDFLIDFIIYLTPYSCYYVFYFL
ncbi:M48 family metalloprotease [Arcobacter arenosus]|uniref:Peptidase M48 domain-containing protein n=1 Tax=Arcobacter arenosus TaxID=2576037 RepID=A0A5R8XZ41_9BACT|nr:M48 family metalloprotease [Arcobacter arenosus]TLP37042.1 hypothetical protein FDK22_12420 [Arcobacter arenosus]